MKLYILSIISALFYLSPLLGDNKEPVKLTVHVDQSLTGESQWVYWFSLIGNEYNIVDSCYLQKEKSTFSFEHTFPEEEEYYSTWLTFGKNGPSQTVLYAQDGDNIEVYIDKDTDIFPKGEGSIAVEESYRNLQDTDSLGIVIEQVEESFFLASDEKTTNEIEESLDSLKDYMNWGIRLKFMERSRSPRKYIGYLMVVSDYLPDKDIDSLVMVMKERFPDSREVQMYPERKRYPKETERSKFVRERMNAIVAQKFGTTFPELERPKIDSTAILGIQAYRLGDKVSDVAFKGLDGEIISLKDIKTDYILIDFWASWCGPCRKEIPYLKAVLDKYADDLTVFAISIDSDENHWRNSIKRDKSEIFTHVFADYNTQESFVLRSRFGVRGIPANFLLDKEGTIIAVDLRKDGLMKEMDEKVL